jgi:alcohol dehydrogenase class IV
MAVPTTAGTGAEVTQCGAVVGGRWRQGDMRSLHAAGLAVVDPTIDLPRAAPHRPAWTPTQLIEAFVSVRPPRQ